MEDVAKVKKAADVVAVQKIEVTKKDANSVVDIDIEKEAADAKVSADLAYAEAVKEMDMEE